MLTIPVFVSGQARTYIGIEAGPKWDISRVSDGGNSFSQAATFSSITGVSVWQEVLNNMFVGTGLYYHTQYSGINIDDQRPMTPQWKSFETILIPARLSFRIQNSDFPAGLTFKAGYQFGMILQPEDPYSASSTVVDEAGSQINYSYAENNPASSSLHLLELGASADYLFRKNWKVALEVSHFSGLSDVFTADLNYTTSDGGSYSSNYDIDGTRIQATFNLYVPVSNIWNNRDLRVRTRIEHSSWRGNDVRKQRSVYFGGDIGALWRMFRTSNPAIGPRPLEGRGIFRYSNLHTGGYFGYMFNSALGVDLGAYYQRSSVIFSLMYDHEADLVVRDRAPFFLEVPLSFRYFYDLHKERIHLVPTLGVSMLTHFSGQGYASGSGTFDYSGASVSANYSASRPSRFGFAIRAGLGGEYRLPMRFPLVATLYLHYNHGLTSMDRVDITTSLTEQPAASTLQYMGSGWNLSAGLKIPILLGKENRNCGSQIPSRQ